MVANDIETEMKYKHEKETSKSNFLAGVAEKSGIEVGWPKIRGAQNKKGQKSKGVRYFHYQWSPERKLYCFYMEISFYPMYAVRITVQKMVSTETDLLMVINKGSYHVSDIA